MLYALQLKDDLLHLAGADELGRRLQDLSLINRHRASKKDELYSIIQEWEWMTSRVN